ncbi:MAG: hypothetical protein V3W18_14555 [candidate division Zixibacteria bacterium]
MTEKRSGLRFKVSLEGKPEKKFDMFAFAFDRRGNLLASGPVKEGQAHLDLQDDQAKHARIFIGPDIREKRISAPTVEMMKRKHAYEISWKFESKKRVYELLPIPELHWQCWLWCKCRVRGRVVKPVEAGGVTTDMPVCHARVHICEVDSFPIVIERLPDDLIFRLRDELFDYIERPDPPFPDPPLPDPPIFRFDPRVIDPTPENIAEMWRNLENPRRKISRIGGIPNNPGDETNLPIVPLSGGGPISGPLPMPTFAGLSSLSVNIVRNTLLELRELVWPYLCHWPWIWPYFYTCDEIAVLETDSNGRFETDIWYPCSGDRPDLHFWVEFCIGGVWTTVYRWPIPCGTYWNYVCGSEVTIRITDPRVPWCADPPSMPGKQIAVMLIGNNISMTQIQRDISGQNAGLTTTGKPFGGSLEPHVWFGENLIASGITHYRWSYKRADSDVPWPDDKPWPAMDAPVFRHYSETMADDTLTFKPFLLGPDPEFPGENLFKIQPKNPPLNPGVALSSWAPMTNGRANTASAYFLSHLLDGGDVSTAAGKYELKLKLFDSSGKRVNLIDQGITLKIPTVDGPFGLGVVPTRAVPNDPDPAFSSIDMEEMVIRKGADIVAFRLVLHVDNNGCEAEIYKTAVGVETAGDCGFITYSPRDSAHISFKARHPNNFATFTFLTIPGESNDVNPAYASGSVGSIIALNGFERDAASVFSKNVPVAALVGTCPQGRAAFAETLYVKALATDGWSGRLRYLDRSAVEPFALTKTGP